VLGPTDDRIDDGTSLSANSGQKCENVTKRKRLSVIESRLATSKKAKPKVGLRLDDG
jgi:hypothetical protein